MKVGQASWPVHPSAPPTASHLLALVGHASACQRRLAGVFLRTFSRSRLRSTRGATPIRAPTPIRAATVRERLPGERLSSQPLTLPRRPFGDHGREIIARESRVILRKTALTAYKRFVGWTSNERSYS